MTDVENLKKVYDENIDPMTQIDDALVQAGKDGKFVICQVGGNWCRWCLSGFFGRSVTDRGIYA